MKKCYIVSGVLYMDFGTPLKLSKLEYISKSYKTIIQLSPKAQLIIEKISDSAMATLRKFDDIISQHDIINFMIWFTNSYNLDSIINQLVSSVVKYNGSATHTHNKDVNIYSAKFKLSIAKAIIARPILTGLIK